MAKTVKAKKKSSNVVSLLLFVALGAVFAPPTLIILGIGLTPTIAARFANPNELRGTIAAMAAFNLAGVIPVLGFLYQKGHTLDQAFRLLADVYNWLLMYGGAGLAAVLLWGVPILVQSAYEIQAKQHVKRLDKRRSRLIEEWGAQIIEDSKITPSVPVVAEEKNN
ncbi:hypothetical protein [Sneathiella limimaris]|uniref:hypothetical protein n=1 Tax=Sneathiella limimaris TaxID=1964213 RepID=UPI00146DCE40|nr:hypothetical protein [Sneathiella limimaris]